MTSTSYRTCPRSGLQFESQAENLMKINAVTAVVALLVGGILAIGVVLEPSANRSGFHSKPLGKLDFVYAVAPQHPLAQAPQPLSDALLRQHLVTEPPSRELFERERAACGGADGGHRQPAAPGHRPRAPP